MGKALRSVLIAAVLLLVVGCSGGWSYQLLGWYVDWHLRDYVRFDGELESDYQRRLDTLLRWHQGTQLPDYAAWLREVEELAERPSVPAERWREQGEALQGFWEALMQRVSLHATALLNRLPEARAQELLDNLEQRTDEQAEEYARLSPEERERERAERMEKNVERWTGTLREEQVAMIRVWAGELKDLSDLSIDSRRRWAAAMQRALAEREDEARLQRRLRTLLVTPDELWKPGYATALERNTERTVALLTELHASLDVAQRRELVSTLRDWAQRFEGLADSA